MRFMVLLKADPPTEAGALPDEKLLAEMGAAPPVTGSRAAVWWGSVAIRWSCESRRSFERSTGGSSPL